jgi:hypothetical protein
LTWRNERKTDLGKEKFWEEELAIEEILRIGVKVEGEGGSFEKRMKVGVVGNWVCRLFWWEDRRKKWTKRFDGLMMSKKLSLQGKFLN